MRLTALRRFYLDAAVVRVGACVDVPDPLGRELVATGKAAAVEAPPAPAEVAEPLPTLTPAEPADASERTTP
jgi:hypothetical protein